MTVFGIKFCFLSLQNAPPPGILQLQKWDETALEFKNIASNIKLTPQGLEFFLSVKHGGGYAFYWGRGRTRCLSRDRGYRGALTALIFVPLRRVRLAP